MLVFFSRAHGTVARGLSARRQRMRISFSCNDCPRRISLRRLKVYCVCAPLPRIEPAGIECWSSLVALTVLSPVAFVVKLHLPRGQNHGLNVRNQTQSLRAFRRWHFALLLFAAGAGT